MSAPRKMLRTETASAVRADMRAEVLAGLRARPRSLSSKWFYDRRGSELFERICAQPEYYLTRAELALMQAHASAIAAALGPRVRLVEYGSGSGVKTDLLLGALEDPVAWVPVEISGSALAASVARIRRDFPRLEVLPVVGDFTAPPAWPEPGRAAARTVIYFPGSTIGNFSAADAAELLRGMRAAMGPGGAVLIGVDRVKDPARIEAAYNDAAGVTAAFTLNLLARFNRELGADFDLDAFRHVARWNPAAERIETRIEARRDLRVHLAGEHFDFRAGEGILVEFSCKYTRASFARLAARAGLRIEHAWSDAGALFHLFLLVAATP